VIFAGVFVKQVLKNRRAKKAGAAAPSPE